MLKLSGYFHRQISRFSLTEVKPFDLLQYLLTSAVGDNWKYDLRNIPLLKVR